VQFKRSQQLKRTKIEIIPMIDTMFFLLVFFMLSSLALTRLNGLPVDLPKASTAPRQQAPDLALTVDKSGAIYLDNVPVTVETLGQTLSTKPTPGRALSEATLVINADQSASHGLIVQCIDKARAAGVTKFAIATAPAPGGQP
jgi:biopolymer transport protein ExbD